MKKFYIIFVTLFICGNLFSQVEVEKAGSLYNFWNQPTDYAVYGNYAFVVHDGMIEIYGILSNDKLELINTIDDQNYSGNVKLIDDYLFTNYWIIDEQKYHYAVFNISDPTNPIKIKDATEGSEPNIVTAVVNGNYAYSENLKIWDVSDILNPVLLFASQLEPFIPLEGASWAKPLRVLDGYLIIVRSFYDEFTGNSWWKYNKVDVSDPLNPVNLGVISGFAAGGNVAQMINDTLHYTFPLGWKYLITIENIADPDNPVIISSISGSNKTYPERTLFARIGNYVYARVTSSYIDTTITQVKKVGDIWIINITDPYNPILEKVFFTKADYSFEPTVIGNKVYSISNDAQFGIIDVSDPLNPVEIMTELSDDPYGWPIGKVKVQGDFAFLQSNDQYFSNNMYGYPLPGKYPAVRIVDISDPANMEEVSIIDSATIIQVDGDYLYSNSGFSNPGFSIYNISDPKNPYKESFFARPKAIIDFKVNNGFAYLIMNGIADIYVVDVRDASNPKLVNIFGNGYNGM